MKPGLFWIPGPWAGKLALAMRPRGGDWLTDEAAGWRRVGLDIVVSLLENREAEQLQLSHEGEAAAANGVEFISFPIPDRGVPSSTQAVDSLVARLISILNGKKNVAMHCRQGIGRSGLMAAATLMSSGMRAAQAVEVVGKARGVPIPETPEQLEWLRRLEARPALVP